MTELEGEDFSGFVVKTVETIHAYSSMFTPEGPFLELPTMFTRVHYQGGDIGEMLFDPVGVMILLQSVTEYIDQLDPIDKLKFDEYIKIQGHKVTVTEAIEEE